MARLERMAEDSDRRGGGDLTIRASPSIDGLSAADWDACAGRDDPFVSHAFLLALERSGSTGAEAGWMPQHLTIADGRGRLVGAAPLYLKAHSFGEYVFDWGWAEAYEHAGMAYYPKLQCSVPFTPVPGPRLLVHPDAPREPVQQLLLRAMVELAGQLELSSLHLTFLTETDWVTCRELGLLGREGVQFHFRNRGFTSFGDFLGSLIARKRKAIRKERRLAASSGLRLRTLRGNDIQPKHWESFYRFYRNTCDHKWGRPYLTREFFAELGRTMADRTVMTVAEDAGEPVASALFLCGPHALYGRYWGSVVEERFLHFELCYYRAIELAIELGLERVEAGAQGPHKLQRGYVPARTFSAHWVRDRSFRVAIAQALDREREQIREELRLLAEQSPYREDRQSVRDPRHPAGRRAMHAR